MNLFGDPLLLDIIRAAGWPIWPLILASIAALTLIIERLMSLRTRVVAPLGMEDDVVGVVRQGLPPLDWVERLATSSAMGQVLGQGLVVVRRSSAATEGDVRQALEHAGRTAVHQLERYLNALGTIATAAPLMGLLGTVVGMIEIFGTQSPTSGSANPAQLAHGISVALYNTAFGLMVALPSLMFYRHFRARVDGYRLRMELAAERVTLALRPYLAS